jgi:tetratricopeptide (TPR) repeat protein
MLDPENPPAIEPSVSPTRHRIRWIWVIPAALLLVVILGGAAGFFSGQALHSQRQQALTQARDTEQFNLAMDDMQAGRFQMAIARLESVLQNEPDFPGAAEKRQEALAAINATPTPLPTETPVPSPTPDVSKAEQLLNQAKQQFTDKDFPGMIKTLLTLKVDAPGFQTVRVDGLLWVGLRSNGVHLIKDTNRLTEGLYFLDLASNYAPLDKEASDYADFARIFLDLYQEAYYYRTKDIEISMKDFEQVVGMRRYYRDNLVKDYVDILIQNGDALMRDGRSCGAVEYYDKAVTEMPDYQKAIDARDKANQECAAAFAPTPTPTPELTPTATTP